MARDYPRLTIEDFGRHLLASGDLDPVYIALSGHNSPGWDFPVKARWMIAYWCLYHCGAASYICAAEGHDFWGLLDTAARNEIATPFGGRWPRGHERRHWRGQQAVKSCDELRRRYGNRPEDMVVNVARAAPSFENVAQMAQQHRGFGPWISFKIADMLDRCLGHKVDFTNAAVFMFKDPVEAALQQWRVRFCGMDRMSLVRPKNREAAINHVVEYLIDTFRDEVAPPLGDRAPNLQEVETILCKWKSHMNGHYPLDNDIDEINAGLGPWLPHSQLAQDFRQAMPGS